MVNSSEVVRAFAFDQWSPGSNPEPTSSGFLRSFLPSLTSNTCTSYFQKNISGLLSFLLFKKKTSPATQPLIWKWVSCKKNQFSHERLCSKKRLETATQKGLFELEKTNEKFVPRDVPLQIYVIFVLICKTLYPSQFTISSTRCLIFFNAIILLWFLTVSIKSVKLLSRSASYLMALKLQSVTAGNGRLWKRRKIYESSWVPIYPTREQFRNFLSKLSQ